MIAHIACRGGRAKDASERIVLDLAKGVGVPGVRQSAGEGHPETEKVLEELMAAGPAANSARQ